MRGIGGTITGRELAGYYSSGEAPFGAILMATGDGNCFWATLLGDITVVMSEGDSDSVAVSLSLDEGDSTSAFTVTMGEGDST